MTSSIVEQHIPCPSCPSSDAYCLYDDGHGYCFSCHFLKPKDKNISDDSATYEYLPHRGINKDVFEFYDVKTKIDNEGKPIELGFIYPDKGVKVRTISPKGFYSPKDKAPKNGLFGKNKFNPGSNKTITITEGELDALSLYQVLRSPVVSVRSSSSARMDASVDRSYLNSFERIYLAFDGDEPGRAAAAEVAKLFDYNKVFDVRFSGERKDANDFLRNGDEAGLRTTWYNAKKFLPDNLVSTLTEFEKELSKPVKHGIPLPFPTLNNMTYGLRTGEVFLITAQTGVGKTSVSHAFLHSILKETNDAVGAIFLEESKQRLLQAMAGLELRRPVHLPDSGCKPAEVFDALKQVVRSDDRLYVYNHFGTDSPDTILDTIRFLVTARGCRWIVFDLITLAVTGLGGDREREALDYISARLEIMTQELDFGVVVVSHENDNGQTRGSRMVAYNCHVHLQLKRDVSAESDRLRLTTELILKKNRPTSISGPAGKLLFDPITHTLSEDFGEALNDNQTLEEMAA